MQWLLRTGGVWGWLTGSVGVVGLGAAYAIYLVEAYRVAVSGVGAHDALCRAGPRDEMKQKDHLDHHGGRSQHMKTEKGRVFGVAPWRVLAPVMSSMKERVGLHRLNLGRLRKLGGELLWVGSGQAAAALGSMVGVRLLTGVLSPSAYGELSLGMTLGTLVNQVVLGPLGGAALRFSAPAKEAGELGPFLTVLRQLIGSATAIVLILTAGASLILWVAGQTRWLGLAALAFGFALFSGYSSALNGLQNAARQRTIVAWHQALFAWARFLAAVGLVRLLGATSAIAMLGYLLSTLLVVLSQLWFYRRTVRLADTASSSPKSRLNHWRSQILSYGWPFAIWGSFTWAQLASDRWALQAFSTTQDVGLYSVLYQLGYYPITVLAGLMVQLVSPVAFEKAGDASDPSRLQEVNAIVRALTVGSLLLTGGAVLVAFILHEPIFRWLAAPGYRAVSWLLPGVVLAGGLFATGQFAILSLLSGVETRILVAPKVVMAIIGLLLNLAGAAYRGIVGVVGAGIVTALMYLAWILSLLRGRCREQQSKAQDETPISPCTA